MDVRALLSHLVGVLDRIAALGNGEDPFAVVETHAPDDNWSVVWAKSGTHAAGAWRDDAVLERPMALAWIQGNGADVLTSYFSELTVHTWDLAVATGQQPHWDDTVVTAALEARRILPAENRRALFEEISAAIGLDEVPSRSTKPSPCTATPPPSIASSPGTAGIPVADPAARCRFVFAVPPGRRWLPPTRGRGWFERLCGWDGGRTEWRARTSLPNAGHRGCLIAPSRHLRDGRCNDGESLSGTTGQRGTSSMPRSVATSPPARSMAGRAQAGC
jgi:uncharacterized protein (TIGR03086 family)